MPHVAGRNRFIDPSDGSDYVWAINHDAEQQFGRQANIELSAPTADQQDFVRQEGQQAPLEMQLSGTILTHAQYGSMWTFWGISRLRTIYFEDFTGAQFEVTITSFQPTRQRTVRNPRGGTDAPTHYWTYTLTMQVINVISGWP